MIIIISAIQEKDNAIGKDNSLLFTIRKDMAHFKALTMGHPVIMGRKTYDSLPSNYQPLPGRTNIVVTRNTKRVFSPEVIVSSSLSDAIFQAKIIDNTTFIIGGGKIYEESFKLNCADILELTVVNSNIDGNVFFPEWKSFGTITKTVEGGMSKEGYEYKFITVKKSNKKK